MEQSLFPQHNKFNSHRPEQHTNNNPQIKYNLHFPSISTLQTNIQNIIKRRQSMKLNILFFHKQNSSFIQQDKEILSKHYNVTDFHYTGISCIPRLILSLRKVDCIYCWFISIHTFILTALTRKPKILVAGGYDVANVPSINYGLARKRSTKFLVSYCLKRATSVLAVSKSNQKELKDNYKYHKSTVIYNCIDTDYFNPKSPKDKNLIITTGAINNVTLDRKGIRHVFTTAVHSFNKGLPYNFVVIGKIDPKINTIIEHMKTTAPNLTFTDYISKEDLLSYYQEAKIYLQLSEHEGFGLSVIEALACNCIPIVSNKYALPEVIDGLGHTVDNQNITQIIETIDTAIQQTQLKGHQYVKTNFDISIREKALTKHINKVISGVKK